MIGELPSQRSTPTQSRNQPSTGRRKKKIGLLPELPDPGGSGTGSIPCFARSRRRGENEKAAPPRPEPLAGSGRNGKGDAYPVPGGSQPTGTGRTCQTPCNVTRIRSMRLMYDPMVASSAFVTERRATGRMRLTSVRYRVNIV